MPQILDCLKHTEVRPVVANAKDPIYRQPLGQYTCRSPFVRRNIGAQFNHFPAFADREMLRGRGIDGLQYRHSCCLGIGCTAIVESHTQPLALDLYPDSLEVSRVRNDSLDKSRVPLHSFRQLDPPVKPVFEPVVRCIRGVIDPHHRLRGGQRPPRN